jgi:predicted PurR-regulated permease PerM
VTLDRVTDGETSPRALIAWTVGLVVVTVVLCWALYLARSSLVLVYVSALLAMGLAPLVRAIERRGMLLPQGFRRPPRWLATLIVYLVLLGTAAAVVLVVFPPLVTQAREFAGQLPQLAEQAQQTLVRRGILSRPLTVEHLVQQAPAGTDAIGTLLGTFWGFIGGVVGLFTILILTFYFVLEAEDIFRAFVRLFPRRRRPRVRAVGQEIARKVSAWLSGQLMLAATIGIVSGVWLGLLGVPFFYVLALLAAVGELVPYVGPLLAAVPGVAVALTDSTQLAVIVAALYFAQQLLENYLLVPKIMERQVGISPVVVIVALLLGGSLLGVAGAILAVPTAAIVQVLVQELTERDEAPSEAGAPEAAQPVQQPGGGERPEHVGGAEPYPRPARADAPGEGKRRQAGGHER